MYYPAEYGRSRSNVLKEIGLKKWPLASCLSRSLKVIGTAMDRSTTKVTQKFLTSFGLRKTRMMTLMTLS